MLLTTAFISLIGALAAASPLQERKDNQKQCKNPVTRVEWRQLPAKQQQSYIDAVLCLKTKPSRIGLATPLFDDFAYVHTKVNLQVHNVAAFLPWHRYFTHLYESALRSCGYTGHATYWDWTQDVNAFRTSPVWASTRGFGGDGSRTRVETLDDAPPLYCVDSGPFRNLRPAYYQERAVAHCLHRSWISGGVDGETLAQYYNATYIGIVQSRYPTFETYHRRLEADPHGVIHAAIGGEMNPSSSPNEPMFFLHHGQVDRLWWMWQQQQPRNRTCDYSGNRVQQTEEGQEVPQASLDDVLPYLGLAKDLTVREVMDTRKGELCYKY